MRRGIVLLALFLLPVTGWAEAGFVVVCPVEDMVDDGLGVLIDRALREARGAEALILEVDTPGGLIDAAVEIAKALGKAPCPTIAYVKGMGAISAGALISYSCDYIIMEPDTNIGAATPVIVSAGGMQPTGEKEVSYMRAKMRALAESNGHNPAIAEAMVDKDIELRAYIDDQDKTIVFGIYPDGQVENAGSSPDPLDLARRAVDALPPELDSVKKAVENLLPEPDARKRRDDAGLPPDIANSRTILPAGKLLTLTAKEAQNYGVIPTTVKNLEEVLSYYGYYEAEVRRIAPTWAEQLYRFLSNPMVAGILLMLGIGGMYLEIKTPGFGIPGIVAITCLSLFFGSHIILGIADWLDILLVLTGIVLILVEMLILPGFGIVGGAGIVCLAAGLYLSLTRVTVPQYEWDYLRLYNAATSLGTMALSLTLFGYLAWKILPHTPFYGMLVLSHAENQEAGYVVQTAGQQTEAIGLHGVAATMLRPAGIGRFEGKTYRVVSRSDYIESGAPIMIVEADGNRYVVDRTEEIS
ncbi:MAG: hypothetical protein GWP08_17175 [Nitrospiraceae bacterium]|nr:hypothetical protein [Nitrospiraceae bacterium]